MIALEFEKMLSLLSKVFQQMLFGLTTGTLCYGNFGITKFNPTSYRFDSKIKLPVSKDPIFETF